MPPKHSLGARLRYRWDTMLARGTGVVIAWLGVVTIALVVVAGAAIQIAGVTINGAHPGFFEGVWQALMRAMDSGTEAGDSGAVFRAISLVVTLGGIFIVTALIGLVATGLDRRLAELRKGRSAVIETGHTLILGWSPKLFTILEELSLANESRRDACVVVMAPRDKVEMDDEIRARVGPLRTTRVVCRTGQPSDPGDIAIVDPLHASSVIVLQPDDEDAPDAAVVRTVLALMRIDPALSTLRVVAEFSEAGTAETIAEVTGGKVLTVTSADIIARITAHVCRQPGLSLVFQDLLDFDGAEVYLVEEPRLDGRTFADCVRSYPTCAVIGLRRPDGTTLLAPDPSITLAAGDHLVLVAEDDSTVVLGEPTAYDVPVVPPQRAAADRADRILVVGWNALGPMILTELDNAVAPGSVADVLADPALVDPRDEIGGTALSRLRVVRHDGDTGRQANLQQLLGQHGYDHVVVLCYGGLKPADADARTLVTLLQLQKLLPVLQPSRPVSVVSQLLDARDVELAKATTANDFVVSEKLTSFVLAQLAEDPERGTVFRDLFDTGGSDVALQPAETYVPLDVEIPFGAVVESALRAGHAVLGYRAVPAGSDEPVIAVNPPKAATVRFRAGDHIVVVKAATPAGSPLGVPVAAQTST